MCVLALLVGAKVKYADCEVCDGALWERRALNWICWLYIDVGGERGGKLAVPQLSDFRNALVAGDKQSGFKMSGSLGSSYISRHRCESCPNPCNMGL